MFWAWLSFCYVPRTHFIHLILSIIWCSRTKRMPRVQLLWVYCVASDGLGSMWVPTDCWEFIGFVGAVWMWCIVWGYSSLDAVVLLSSWWIQDVVSPWRLHQWGSCMGLAWFFIVIRVFTHSLVLSPIYAVFEGMVTLPLLLSVDVCIRMGCLWNWVSPVYLALGWEFTHKSWVIGIVGVSLCMVCTWMPGFQLRFWQYRDVTKCIVQAFCAPQALLFGSNSGLLDGISLVGWTGHTDQPSAPAISETTLRIEWCIHFASPPSWHPPCTLSMPF